MQGFVLWISALRISMDFISFDSQSERSIIDYLTKSAHFILFRMGQSFEVLTVFFYKQTSDQYYYSTVRGYMCYIYIRQKCRDALVLSLPFSRFGRTAHSYSYLDWHNPHSYPFCVHLPLIDIARTQFFIRWMECNTPLPEYVLSCVFIFSDRIFLIYFRYSLYYELFMRSFCRGFRFVNQESALV